MAKKGTAMKNWQTIKRLLTTTFWGVCVLISLGRKGHTITAEQFMGPFTTVMGCDCHNLRTCLVMHKLRMLT